MAIIEKLLEIGNTASDIIIDALTPIFGFQCDVYYPIVNQSIYGSESGSILYNEEPDFPHIRLLMTGIISERFDADITQDIYNQEEIVLWRRGDDEIPLDSKIVIHIVEDRLFSYKVRSLMTMPGADENIYNRYILSPMEITYIEPPEISSIEQNIIETLRILAPDTFNAIFDDNSLEANLTWNNRTGNSEYISIERSTDNLNNFEEIDQISSDLSSYNDDTIEEDHTYFYRIRVSTVHGFSSYSEIDDVYYPLQPPDTPTNFSSTFNSNQIELTWTDVADTELNYMIERSVNNELNYTHLITLDADIESYTDTTILEDNIYYYRLRSYNSAGYSDYVYANASYSISSPTSLTGNNNSTNSRIDLAWTDNSTHETQFNIERRNTNEPSFTVINSVSNNVTLYSDEDVVLGETYFYRIQAIGANTVSDYSNIVEINYIQQFVTLDRYYQLNESSGLIASDSSTNGENATSSGSSQIVWQPSNGINGCLQLNGSSYSYFTASSYPFQINGNYTIEARIALGANTLGSNGMYLSSGTSSGYLWGLRAIQNYNNTNQTIIDFHIQNSYTDTFYIGASFSPAWGIDEWHHTAITINRSAGICNLYIDGNLESSSTEFENNNVIGSGFFRIGCRSGANDFRYNGQIDEIRLWNSIRTQQEIQNNMNIELF